MPKKALIILAVFLLIATGCSKRPNQFAGRDIYNHPKAGFSIQVPRRWEKINEDDFGVDFVDRQEGIAANILLEVGGLSYFDIDSLGREVIKYFQQSKNFSDVEVVVKEKSNVGKNAYRIILEGNDKDGNRLASKIFIFDVDAGIRYYVVFSAGKEVYYRYDYEFEDLARTFMVFKKPKELYQLIPESRMPADHPDIDRDRQEESNEKNKEPDQDGHSGNAGKNRE